MPTLANAVSNAQTIHAASANSVRVLSRGPYLFSTRLLGPYCPRKHVRRVVCQLYMTGLCPLGPECPRGQCVSCLSYICADPIRSVVFSPKPNLPSLSAYEPPSPPTNRDLGPPPPGYGRYADFDRANAGGVSSTPGAPGAPPVPRRNLDDVLCFKVGRTLLFAFDICMLTGLQCGEKGHYANHCRNRNVPGNRGGVDRSRRFGGAADD